MNWKFHTFIFVLVVVVFGSGKSLACSCQEPIAEMTIEPSTYENGKYYVCAGESITFDASGSSDPDCESCSSCNGVSLVNGIRKFEWDWTNDSSYDETDEPGDGKATHEYEAGEYTVKLKVTDNDDDCCCSGTGCEDNFASKTYDIVAAKVYIDTPEEFPVYVAVGDDVDLGCTFEPSTITGETYLWSKESGPGTVTFSSSSTDEDPSFSADTAGEYEVKVVCTIGGYPLEDTAGKFIVVLSGSLVLEDKHSGNSEADQANGGPPPPDTLYAGTDATDGNGDVKFWIVDPDLGEDYDWEITPGDYSGTLTGTADEDYEGECDDLEAGEEYTITVTTDSDPTYERKIEFIIPKLEITNDADEIITTTQTVSVGSEIHLKTKIEPSGLTASDWVWTVPEIRVKDYVTTDLGDGRSKAEVIYLEETDLDDDNVTFYWVDGADGRSVSVSCKIEGVTCTDTVQFNVKRPTTSLYELNDGEIDVTHPGAGLHYGTQNKPGFEWTMIVYGDGFAGDIKYTQVLEADVQRTKTDDSTESWKIPTKWLDVTDPYAGKQDSITTAYGSQVLAMYDWPSIELNTGFKKMNNKFMTFNAYLMFKPEGTDSIWVPLARALWGWKGITESSDGGNTWSDPPTSTEELGPTQESTTDFPEWDDTRTKVPEHPEWEAD